MMQDSEIRKLCEEVEEYCKKATRWDDKHYATDAQGPFGIMHPDKPGVAIAVCDNVFIPVRGFHDPIDEAPVPCPENSYDGQTYHSERVANVRFIARARTDLPKLVAALREKPKAERWIPVSERLPEEDGKYLCWHAKKTPVISYFTEQTFWNDGEAQNVTHWKPISAPEVKA